MSSKLTLVQPAVVIMASSPIIPDVEVQGCRPCQRQPGQRQPMDSDATDRYLGLLGRP